MTVQYVVTFEFDTKAPLTHRGTVTACEVPTCASKAVKQARKALQPSRWASVVCVLLERRDNRLDSGS